MQTYLFIDILLILIYNLNHNALITLSIDSVILYKTVSIFNKLFEIVFVDLIEFIKITRYSADGITIESDIFSFIVLIKD